MKKLLLLISFIIVHVYSYAQTDVQRDNRVSPVLKSALVPKSGYFIYGRDNSSRLIDIAVLNQSSHTMTWFTCHGGVFDSTKLTNQEYEQVTSKQVDPFVLYQHICNEYLDDIAAAKDIYRIYGARLVVDSLNPSYHALFASEPVRMAKTSLQKLAAIENIRKNILTQLAYLNCADPFGLHNDPLFVNNKDQAGAMIKTKDSTVYYNIDPTSAVTKIGLYKNSPEKLYIFNRLSQVIDSVPVLPEKYDLLLKEKTDVFLLYRGWLEMQWQRARSNIITFTKSIYTGNVGIYSQANEKDEKAIEKELYSQINAIGAKINLLISPEAKSIDQAVYETYKNETSEISYIPLLGIGYDLNQKRGLKEYELTNHLGNVLVTINDKKLGHSSNDSTVDYYTPDVVTAQDYYPFGMLQPARSYLSPAEGTRYRYGFNGKENDNEVKGEGNQQDYGMRVYDPRLGKFLSLDALSKKYPQLTPYQFCSDRPIDGKDIDGNEYGTIHVSVNEQTGKNVAYYTPYDATNLHIYGPQGKGVAYKISTYNTSSNGIPINWNLNTYTNFQARSASFLSTPTEYGNYMGATGLYTVNKFGKFTQTYSYEAKAIDAVDQAAKMHDIGYDNLNAVGATGLFKDFGTTPLDEKALNTWNGILKNYQVGSIDPFSNQKVTKDELSAAKNASQLFNKVVSSKKTAIADFMYKNYSESAENWHKAGSIEEVYEAREANYQMFLSIYMQQDKDGNWSRNKKMWNTDENGNYTTPKTPGKK